MDPTKWIPAGSITVQNVIDTIPTGATWSSYLANEPVTTEQQDISTAINHLVVCKYVEAILGEQSSNSSTSRRVDIWFAITGFANNIKGRPIAPVRRRKVNLPELKWAFFTLLTQLDTTRHLTSKKSLVDIFHDLPSPTISQHIYDMANDDIRELLGETESEYLDGMKTSLYGYQKRSLWRMIQQEMCPGRLVEPKMIPLQDINNDSYYLSMSTWRFYREPTFYDSTRGGVICEDMGTGKTCICLALILHTRHQLAWPDDREITCDLVEDMKGSNGTAPSSLMNLLTIKIIMENIPYRLWRDSLPSTLVHHLDRYPPYYYRNEDNSNRRRRSQLLVQRLKVYLASTTLVVVPANLVDQWTNEINKHVDDLSCRLRVISHREPEIPTARELIHYDIVLISNKRFAIEHAKGGFEFTGIPLSCHCSYIGSTLTVDCHCQKGHATFHWKRLIIDEGHVMSSTTSHQTLLASKLTAERRWIATGTPTQNLAATVNRVEAERDDMKRLGGIIGTFLLQQPFSSCTNTWNKRVTKPFFDGEFGAVDRVERILYPLMIRNRPESIEEDVQLPPLYETIVTLRFTPVQRLTYNTLIALQHLNARVDRDYFFHPINRKPLAESIANLWQSCFWFMPAKLDHLHEAIRHARNGLDRAEERGYSDTDIQLLHTIIEHLQEAIMHDTWVQLLQNHEPNICQHLTQDLRMKCIPQYGNEVDGDDQQYSIPLDHLPLEVQRKQLDKKMKLLASTENDDINNNSLPKNIDDVLRVDQQADETLPKGQHVTSAAMRRKISRQQREKELAMVRPYLTPLHKTAVRSSTSCKLTIYMHVGHEKCILFTQFNNDMYYLHEALCLSNIRCLLYHTQGMVTYGIDLSSASRVYFVSPVWQNAMMRQAVKRAHRIGQTRPVYVETLVVEGTLEQTILKRRQEMTHSVQTSSITDDRGMRHMLSNATFVGSDQVADATLLPSLPFLPKHKQQVDTKSSRSDEHPSMEFDVDVDINMNVEE
ncbi:SNF2 family N-terminal domain-containing protein [Syncephalis plumigaleata]|nr:SNF2 family N-terminal domain-containing protein [Syncephalis plumigaleata]